jgi:hypothetical protein
MNRKHYEWMREFIISSFEETTEISFTRLVDDLSNTRLTLPQETALWYLIKVKQDLEARGILKISFITSSRHQILKLNRRALKKPVIPY